MSATLLSGSESARTRRAALVTGPVLLFAGAILMMLPNAWVLSHMVFLVGALAMLPAGVVLYDGVGGAGPAWVRRSGLAFTVTGALALAGQFVIDVAVMRLAGGEREIAGAMFDEIQESPVFALVLYTAGPALLFVGLALFGAAAIIRSGPRFVPGWLLVAGTLLMGAARMTGSRAGEVAGLGVIALALALARV